MVQGDSGHVCARGFINTNELYLPLEGTVFFATADQVDGARECVRHVGLVTLENHDPRTRDFPSRVGNDLGQRAEGGDATEALLKEVVFCSGAISMKHVERGITEKPLWERHVRQGHRFFT